MERFLRLAAAGIATTMMAGAALASTGSLSEFKSKVMPVLVHVDSHGNVTEVSPSSQLSPPLRKQLEKNLDGWINQPGLTNGRPAATVLIVNVALETVRRGDGNYDLSFRYVSSAASPFYSAHWAKINGHELAVVDNTGGFYENRDPISHQYYDFSTNRSFLNHQLPNAIQSNPRSVPTSSPPKGH